MKEVAVTALAFVMTSTVPSLAANKAPAPRWRGAANYTHYSGDYGTSNTVQTTVVEFIGERLFGENGVNVTVPFVSNTGEGVVLVGNKPVPTHGNGHPPAGKNETTTTTTTESGLGDVTVRGHLELLEETPRRPQLTGEAFMKLPTADEARGLGTGEFDEGMNLSLYKEFTPSIFASAEAGYTFIGDPPGTDLHDKWNYSFGIGRVLTKGLNASVAYSEERAIAEGTDNPREISLTVTVAPQPRFSLSGEFLAGLSDGAPNSGITLGGSYKF